MSLVEKVFNKEAEELRRKILYCSPASWSTPGRKFKIRNSKKILNFEKSLI